MGTDPLKGQRLHEAKQSLDHLNPVEGGEISRAELGRVLRSIQDLTSDAEGTALLGTVNRLAQAVLAKIPGEGRDTLEVDRELGAQLSELSREVGTLAQQFLPEVDVGEEWEVIERQSYPQLMGRFEEVSRAEKIPIYTEIKSKIRKAMRGALSWATNWINQTVIQAVPSKSALEELSRDEGFLQQADLPSEYQGRLDRMFAGLTRAQEKGVTIRRRLAPRVPKSSFFSRAESTQLESEIQTEEAAIERFKGATARLWKSKLNLFVVIYQRRKLEKQQRLEEDALLAELDGGPPAEIDRSLGMEINVLFAKKLEYEAAALEAKTEVEAARRDLIALWGGGEGQTRGELS